MLDPIYHDVTSRARSRMQLTLTKSHRCYQLVHGKQTRLCLFLPVCAVAVLLFFGGRPSGRSMGALGGQNERNPFFHIGIVTMMEPSDRQVMGVVTRGAVHACACFGITDADSNLSVLYGRFSFS